MYSEAKRAYNLLGFWAGIGSMCGEGYEYAKHLIIRSDAEHLASDWEAIGQDWRNVLAQVEEDIKEDQAKQAVLDFHEAESET